MTQHILYDFNRGMERVFNGLMSDSFSFPAPSGPVLRKAVQSTLIKRQMKFICNKGNGSFTVDVLSGIDLYASPLQKADTKVQLRSFPTDSINLISRPPPSSELPSKSSNVDDENDTHVQSSSSALVYASDPLPSDVAREEILIQEIKAQSLKERSMKISQQMREETEFQKVMQLSLEGKEKMERHEQFEQEELKRVMEESKTLEAERNKEELMLKRVLEESKQAEDRIRAKEGRMIRAALEESEKHSASVKGDDSSIQEALVLSKRFMTLGDDLGGGGDSYEEQIEKAIQQSLYFS